MERRQYLTNAEKSHIILSCKDKKQYSVEKFIKSYSTQKNISVKPIRKFLDEQNIYKYKKTQRRWTREEVEYLEQLAGNEPIDEIFRLLKLWAYKNKVKPHGKRTIQDKMYKLGLQESALGEYLNAEDVSNLIGCDVKKVVRWCNEGETKKILSPIRNNELKTAQYRIHRKNVIKFCIKYRDEISVHDVNVSWLLSLLID
jgi:hypothetical protein